MINFRLHKFFNRFHQKVTLVDNTLFIGSINIAEEYSNIKYGTMGFIDLNIYLKNSPSQKKVLKFFHEIISENIDQVSKAQANLINNLLIKEDVIIKLDENGKAIYNDEVILSYRKDDIYEEFLEEKPPEKSEIQDSIYSLLESAESSITIVAPYYLNLKRVDDLLVKALKRGVKVQIFTSLKRDQPAYKYFYNSELFKNLMNNGAEVYEFMDKVLHLKAYYVDQKLLNLGSMNNDITSFVLNNEANYLIRRNDYNTSVFRKFDQILLDVKDNSRRLNSNIYKNPFRVAYTYWWYFFIYMMETTVANRKPKHNN